MKNVVSEIVDALKLFKLPWKQLLTADAISPFTLKELQQQNTRLNANLSTEVLDIFDVPDRNTVESVILGLLLRLESDVATEELRQVK